MNDVLLMDQFIKKMAGSISDVTNFSAAEWSHTIYYYFVRQGVNNNEQQMDLEQSGHFSRWQRYFSGKANCKCFVDEDWKYFCQFVNEPQEVIEYKEQIKIYIPLDYEHIEIGVEAIFDFLERNNIKHISKVGKHIRFDDIVVRVTNEKDANELQRFIDKNTYIQRGLIKSNPFAFNRNGIAYACDGRLSYNGIVSDAISVYLEDMKNNNELDRVGIENFITYCASRYENIALKHDDSFIRDLNGGDLISSKQYKNYLQVCELFIDTMLTKLSTFYKQIAHDNPVYSEQYKIRFDYITKEFGDTFSFKADPINQFYKNSRSDLNIDKK